MNSFIISLHACPRQSAPPHFLPRLACHRVTQSVLPMARAPSNGASPSRLVQAVKNMHVSGTSRCARGQQLLKPRCSQCRSRVTCTLLAGGDSNATFAQLGATVPAHTLPEKSVHRRTLPDELVGFSSPRGRRYFAEAMAEGHMEPYFPLIEQFVTQDEPTFCGLGTLTMVMNALRIDPRRRWRDETGPGWRWWSDDMFLTSCSPSLEQLRLAGITMEEFRLLAAANGASISMHRPTDAAESVSTFREAILQTASDATAPFTVTSFCRASLGQTGARHARACPACAPSVGALARVRRRQLSRAPRATRTACLLAHPVPRSRRRAQPARLTSPTPCALAGGGHFSPIGGYHAATDSALVLDVARFKYPPYWVAVPHLWQASLAVDEATGQARGWFRLSAAQRGGALGAEPGRIHGAAVGTG